MAPDDEDVQADRRTPVGEPVVRGDADLLGEAADAAVAFDPEDPRSLDAAADTVRTFARHQDTDADARYLLRGAAACAVLVRGIGSYRAAADRAGEDVSVSFIRKWARVHDLARPIRVQVATGTLTPSAAKHIARLSGAARYDVAWATIDHDLSVREVRSIASDIAAGEDPATALAAHDAPLGDIEATVSPAAYRTLWRLASLEGVEPGEIIERGIRALESPDGDPDT
ncbi:MAG: hypothetical protein ABEJ55_07385 [Halanaeroarchaeum sp.]